MIIKKELSFLLKEFKQKHRIKVFNRSALNMKDSIKLELEIYPLGDLHAHISQCDILINATSLGHKENMNTTPVASTLLKNAKKTLIIFDIIYDPIKTPLLANSKELGLRTINGLRMNLIQAVLAYSYTNSTSLPKEEIYKVMS